MSNRSATRDAAASEDAEKLDLNLETRAVCDNNCSQAVPLGCCMLVAVLYFSPISYFMVHYFSLIMLIVQAFREEL